MSIDDIYEMNTDWCASCGAEHGYMCGPCEKCGSTTFTKKRPPKIEDRLTTGYWVDNYMVTATYSCTCNVYGRDGNCQHIQEVIKSDGERN